MVIADPPDGLPSLDTVLLPSRAVFRSWRSQTIPARLAALEESEELFAELGADDDPGLRDMALLGLVADAMQPLEDLAYLATAADAPFQGIANYIRATTYSDRIPTNFWQGIDNWAEDRLDVLAGFAMRNPDTKTIISVLDLVAFSANLDADALLVLDKARTASHRRLRSTLSSLAADWEQFGPCFRAFKHGGLAINRADAAFVDDGVANLADQTPRLEPSLAVWRRRGGAGADDEVFADHNLAAEKVREYVAESGRIALGVIDRFLESRLALVESLEVDDAGTVNRRDDESPATAGLPHIRI